MYRFLKALVIFCVLIYLASLAYVLSFTLKKRIPAHADAVLILGAKVNLDNTPSEALQNRTDEAINLFKQGKADYIITTGGVGLGKASESAVAAEVAKEDGIPQNKILSEDQSHDTYDNLANVVDLAKAHNIRSLIVVSDEYHVGRGVLVARHLGFNPVYWDYPSMRYLNNSDIVWDYFREGAAVLAYLPKVLGF